MKQSRRNKGNYFPPLLGLVILALFFSHCDSGVRIVRGKRPKNVNNVFLDSTDITWTRLSWVASSTEGVQYRIVYVEEGTASSEDCNVAASDTTYVMDGIGSSTSAIIEGLRSGTGYIFRVFAVGKNGNCSSGAIAKVTTPTFTGDCNHELLPTEIVPSCR